MTEISDSLQYCHIILKQLQLLSYITTIYIMSFLVLVIPRQNRFVIYLEKSSICIEFVQSIKEDLSFLVGRRL